MSPKGRVVADSKENAARAALPVTPVSDKLNCPLVTVTGNVLTTALLAPPASA